MGREKASRKPRRPATTLEGRENQLISLAADLAEKQMISGNVSAQVLTHFLKLGSTRERLEQERLQRENLLLSAKVDQIASSQRVEELYITALQAMRRYTGEDPGGYQEEYEDE